MGDIGEMNPLNPDDVSKAIASSTTLLVKLIDRIKDRETAALAAELQSTYFTIRQELIRLQSENANLALDKRNLDTQLFNLKQSHVNETTELRAEISRLKAQPSPRQADELEQGTIAVLKFLFDAAQDVSGRQIARQFNMHPSVLDHYIDKLLEKRLIEQATVGGTGADCSFRIESKGRDYIIKSGLFDPNQRPPQRPPNDPHRLGMM